MPRILMCVALICLTGATGGLSASANANDAQPGATGGLPALSSSNGPAGAATPTAAAITSTAPALPPQAPDSVPSELVLGQRRAAIAKELQEISTKFLGSLDPVIREQGRQRALMIRDPLATEPVVRVLGSGDEESRSLACQILAQLPAPEASVALARIVLMDVSDAVRTVAVAAIKQHADKAALQPLLNGLRGTGPAADRAAAALGEVGNLPAALAMVSLLRKPENRSVDVLVTPSATGMNVGTSRAYVSGAHSVVSGGAVAVVPEISWTGQGVGYGSTTPPQPYMAKRDITVLAEQPLVLAALKKITGQNFEYDVVKWRMWIGKAIADERAAQSPAATASSGATGGLPASASTPEPTAAPLPVPPPPLKGSGG
jgi:hypothetical protein